MFNVVALFMIVVSALTAQAPLTGIPGSVQGTVCEVGTCKPIAGARLVISMPETPGTARTTTTDIGGTFRFQQLQPGKYRLQVEADNHGLATVLSLIAVPDGGGVEGLKIEMSALGTISGRAFDETGEPLVGARIEAMTFRGQGQHFHILAPIAGADTDDRGEFRIPALDPGEYYVRVLPPDDRVLPDSYPVTYYPNTTDPSAAAKVVVAGGAEIAGIEPKLSSRGVKVRGRVIDPKNENTSADLLLLPRTPAVLVLPLLNPNTMDHSSDDFELRGVAPGAYYLYAITRTYSSLPIEWIRYSIDVGNRDVENVPVTLIPAGSIKGRIVFASDVLDPENLDLSRVRIHADTSEVVPAAPRTGAIGQVRITPAGKSGEFLLEHVSEMKLFLDAQFPGDEWFVSSISLDGADVLATGLIAGPGRELVLDVIISNAGGTLAGVIKDREGKPVPAGRLVLMPSDSRRENPFLLRTGVAVEKGEFMIETIRPGEYTAIALPDEDQFTPTFLRNLESVGKYERFGTRVHIGARETTRVDLTVAPIEP